MRKIIVSSCFFVMLCALANIFVIPNLTENAKVLNIENETTSNILTYIVKDFNGNIAVYESGSDHPFKVTGVLVSTLPELDQKMLESGIEAHGDAELVSLLEDLCS